MAEKLADQHGAAGNRAGEHQLQGAAINLAGNGVKRQEQRDQRHQVDRQCRQAGDDHGDRVGLDFAAGRAAKKHEDQRKGEKDQRRQDDPAVAKTDPDFCCCNGQNAVHYKIPRWASSAPVFEKYR